MFIMPSRYVINKSSKLELKKDDKFTRHYKNNKFI